MNLERFVGEGAPVWNELDLLIKSARGRPERLKSDGVRKLGRLYRRAAADLSYARRRWPGDPVVARLDGTVHRARVLVYNSRPSRASVLEFVTTTYWQRIRERWVPLLLATGVLLGSMVATGVWADSDPGSAINLVPADYRSITEPRGSNDLDFSATESAAFSSIIFTNNIQVSFTAWAAGVLFGLGTLFLLLYNGVFLGAVAGLAVEAGNGRVFFELVTAHGVLELSCIVVTAAAGLRLGWAIVSPGTLSRRESVLDEGKRSVEILLGTIPWLVIAGLIEGFVTPGGFPLPVILAVGFGAAGVYWWLVMARGKPA